MTGPLSDPPDASPDADASPDPNSGTDDEPTLLQPAAHRGPGGPGPGEEPPPGRLDEDRRPVGEPERETDATIRSISRLEESN